MIHVYIVVKSCVEYPYVEYEHSVEYSYVEYIEDCVMQMYVQ